MQRRTLLRIAKNHWPKTWRPLRPGLPPLPHPLALQLAHVAQWFHALSDTGRLAILEFLSQRDRFANELSRHIDMPRSTVIFHLTVLRDSGLVREYRDGRRKYYSLRGETLDLVVAFTRLMGPGTHVGTCPRSCCQALR